MTVAGESSRTTVTEAELDLQQLSRVVVGASVLGLYAGWMTADVAARWLTFPAVSLLAGYVLFGKARRHDQVVFVGYGLAVLVALTPVMMVLPDLLSAGSYGVGSLELVFLRWNLYLLVLFLIPAAVVAYATYRFDGGRGVLARVRDRKQ